MAHFEGDDLRLLAESVDRYVNEAGANGGTAGNAQDDGAWRSMADLGWLGLLIDPHLGGIGGGAAAMGHVMEGIGRGLFRVPYLSTAVIAARLIERAGSDGQKAGLLERIACGALALAFAHREPDSGHDQDWITMVATPAGGGYVLDGAKQFVLDGPNAELVLVSARIGDADGQWALFLVDPASAGVRRTDYPSVDRRPVSDFRFDGLILPESARLPGPARAAIEEALDLATLGMCAEACGVAAQLNAATLEYLKTRKQFGVPLGTFQVLQHRMVDMTVAEYQLKAITDRAIALYDAGAADARTWVSAAKIAACELGRSIAHGSIQLHGGMGMTDELIVGHYLKRMLMIGTLYGDENWHLDRIDALASAPLRMPAHV